MYICSYTGPKSVVCVCENPHFPSKSGERNTRGVLGDGGEVVLGQNGSCPLVFTITESFPRLLDRGSAL